MIYSSNPEQLIELFLRQPMGSAWVVYGRFHLSMYLRKRPMLTIANMSFESERQMGKGRFTAFLDAIEPLHDLHIENVLNPRLVPFFLRRGYTTTDNFCFTRLRND